MSLLRLLAVGKSLIGLKPAPTPYKMTEANLVPKFDPATPSKGEMGKPTSQGSARTAPPVAAARKPSLLFAALASRSAQKTARKFIQAELSLGQIRVVRNDLQDSDLEVVSTKRRQAKAKMPRDSKPLEPSRTGV